MAGPPRPALLLLLSATLLAPSLCRPPTKTRVEHPQQPETKEDAASAAGGEGGSKDWDFNIEYNRYLQEVVQVLESDPDFRNKLETADVDRIRDGSIADELDFVHHNVRSQLDDIKRRELERLRHLAMRQYEMENGIDRGHAKIPDHVDFKMPTFEKDDLKRLIKTTTKDLEEADKKRRDDFKKYEMEKKLQEEQMLAHIEDEAKRDEEKKKLEEQKAKHKKHEKPHHPMTKDQLEEVWEEQDHMPADEFDPKTFFATHDLNGDGHWDEDEVKVLFRKELDKVYDPNAPEDDMRERDEEMERMREHVFGEADQNKDKLISFDEFLTETKRDEFENDEGWNTIDEEEQDEFTDEEFRAYEMQRQREIQDMLNRGHIPQGYEYLNQLPPGAQPFIPHPGMMPPNAGVHPGMPQPQIGIPGQPAFRPEQHQQLQQQQAQFQQQQAQFQQQQQQFAQPGQHPQAQAGQFAQQPPQQFAQPAQGQPQQQQFAQPAAGQQQQQFAQPAAAQQQQQFAQPVPAQQQQPPQQFGQPVPRGPAQPQQFGGQQQQQPQAVPQQAASPESQQPQHDVKVQQVNSNP